MRHSRFACVAKATQQQKMKTGNAAATAKSLKAAAQELHEHPPQELTAIPLRNMWRLAPAGRRHIKGRWQIEFMPAAPRKERGTPWLRVPRAAGCGTARGWPIEPLSGKFTKRLDEPTYCIPKRLNTSPIHTWPIFCQSAYRGKGHQLVRGHRDARPQQLCSFGGLKNDHRKPEHPPRELAANRGTI